MFGFACRSTLERYFKVEFNLRGLDMITMESYIKGRITDAARVLDALFSEDKTTDDLIEELARLAASLNPIVRDVRRVQKNLEE